jgi:hypothetical protein
MSDAVGGLFRDARAQSVAFCEPLKPEDYGLQAEDFVSPPKWHLAHTTWFFETFILKPFVSDFVTPEPLYEVLFNSYYNGIGEQYPRPDRGLLSRPTLEEVLEYRRGVDEAVLALLASVDHRDRETILQRLILGVEHERQHQELFFTDLKYSLAVNPMLPTYVALNLAKQAHGAPLHWQAYAGGLVEVGFEGDGFCFDNELPRHKT